MESHNIDVWNKRIEKCMLNGRQSIWNGDSKEINGKRMFVYLFCTMKIE